MKRARPLARLAELNPNLICVLCGGYYIDATALTECIHSFCKTCIVSYLKTNKHCPICQAVIHKTKSNQHLSSDKTLQDLVYKLVPGLYQNEMKRRREFYAKHPNEAPSRVGEARGDENERIWFSKDDIFSISLHYCSQSLKDERTVRTVPLKEVVSSPAESQKDVRYLQCPAGVTVEILKRYIRWKYELPYRYEVDIFHTDECLRDDLTLMDVAYIYTWRRKEPLLLNYTVYEYIVKRIKVECPAPSRLLDLNNLVKSSISGSKVGSKPSEIKPDTKPDLLPNSSLKHDDSIAEPMDVDEKPDTATSSEPVGGVMVRCKTEAPELKDVISEQPASSSSASLSSISDLIPEVKTEAQADDVKEEAGVTSTPCAAIQKQTALSAASAQSTLIQTGGDCPTNNTPSKSAPSSPKAQSCEKSSPQVVGSGTTGCTETVQNKKPSTCASHKGEKPLPVEGKSEGLRELNHCSIGVAKTQTSLGVSVNMPLTPVTKTPPSSAADTKVLLPTSVTKSVAQPPLTRPSQGTIPSPKQLPVSKSTQSPKKITLSKPPSAECAVPDVPATTATTTPVSSKSLAVKRAALSVPKLGPLASLGVATTTNTNTTTTTTNSTVPSAAAAAGGAASPSPASQAASSSPSPPMASSAACVKDVLEPLQKAVDIASRQSADTPSCKPVIASSEATVKPLQVNTAITSPGEAPVENVVTVSKAEVRLATSARSANTTEKSVDVGKSGYGTSSQTKPLPGVFMPSNPNTVLGGTKEDLNVNKECKSRDEKPAVSTASFVISANTASESKAAAASRLSVTSIAGGTLSGRNGMPAVVTKPARVNNASTSVNTLMNKAAIHKQQPPAVVKPVTDVPLPPSDAQQTSTARPSPDEKDGSCSASTTSSSKHNGSPIVTSPGASGPVPKSSLGQQIKSQTSSHKQPPASRHAAPTTLARQQGRRGLASSAAAASPAFRSPLPSAPVSSISGVPSPACTESQPSVATSQPLPSLSTSSTPFAAAMGRHGQNPFLLEQSYLSNPYFQLLHQQQLLSMLIARGQLPNPGALPMLNSLSAFPPQMLAQIAASHAQQHMLPETVRKLQQQHLQTPEADAAVVGKKQQQHQAAVIGSTAAAKKNAESAARRKITDIANSLQKKARQTLSGASASASNAATDTSTDKGGRPPFAHSTSATSTTSTPPLTASRGAGGRGRGEEEQPLNLVMSRGTPVAGGGKMSNGLSQQPQPGRGTADSARKTTA